MVACYPRHNCIVTPLFYLFWSPVPPSTRGEGLSNQGKTTSGVQTFWTIPAFFPALVTMDIPINSYYSEQLKFFSKLYLQVLIEINIRYIPYL